MTEAETGVTLLQAKAHPRPTATTRNQEQTRRGSTQTLRDCVTLLTPWTSDFQPPELRENKFLSSSVWLSVTAAGQTNALTLPVPAPESAFAGCCAMQATSGWLPGGGLFPGCR